MAATTASPDNGTPPVRSVSGRRRWPRLTAIVVVAALLGTGMWLLRWSGGNSRTTPDTFWYARDSFRYAGYAAPSADAMAAQVTCQGYQRVRPNYNYAGCLRYRNRLPQSAPIRFQRIFTSRPGYALLATPFVWVFGGAGFVIGSAAMAVACGVALVVLALAAGMRLIQALLAEALFYLLPTGLWASRLLAEAPMMLCLITSVIGAVLLLTRRRRPAVAAGLLAAGLAALCAVKPANGVALAAALTVVAVVRLPFARARGRYGLVAAVAAAVLIGNFLVSAALRLPGLYETLQDANTRHFHQPDVGDPWARLGEMHHHLLTGHIGPHLLNHPIIAATYLVGAVGLFLRLRPDAAWPPFVAGLTGVMVIAMHPVTTETARLTVATWIPVALGLAALVGTRSPRGADQPRALPAAAQVRGPVRVT
ncbi:MAG TPA: hypothetical protein VFU43_01945 [Streptosporangiaceae bacterium]|nr:hypothetical protein [Streptosporangiaceae bacterium]